MSEQSKPRRLPVEVSKAVIDALGGTNEVARLCDVRMCAVSLWKREGIPRARLMFLRERFKHLPVMKTPEVFDF